MFRVKRPCVTTRCKCYDLANLPVRSPRQRLSLVVAARLRAACSVAQRAPRCGGMGAFAVSRRGSTSACDVVRRDAALRQHARYRQRGAHGLPAKIHVHRQGRGHERGHPPADVASPHVGKHLARGGRPGSFLHVLGPGARALCQGHSSDPGLAAPHVHASHHCVVQRHTRLEAAERSRLPHGPPPHGDRR